MLVREKSSSRQKIAQRIVLAGVIQTGTSKTEPKQFGVMINGK